MSNFDHDSYFADRERWDSQIKENSARNATATGALSTTGWGETVFDDPIMFGVTFVAQPAVAYGFALTDDNQLVSTRFPRCSGGVLRWITSERGFYIGAYAIVTVATADVLLAAGAADVSATYGVDPGYVLTHSFTFTALAIKTIAQ